jgi:RHS repeat-associated protein
MQYDANGVYVIKTTNPLNQDQLIVNNIQVGAPSQITDIDGQVVQMVYNAFGQLIKKKFISKGYDVDYTSDWVLNNGIVYKNKEIHPGAPDVTNYYDILGRVIKAEKIAYNGNIITELKEYNANGTLYKSTAPKLASEPSEITIFTYDAYMRPISSTNSIGTTTFAYSATTAGINTTTVTPPSGYTNITEKDADGVTLFTKDNGGQTNYEYNSLGQVTRIKLGTQIITEYEYDNFGRKIKTIDKAAGTTLYEYDNASRIIKETDARGIISTLTYDAYGRVIAKQITDPNNATNNVSNSYTFVSTGNGLNQPLAVVENGVTIETNMYDNFGRLQSNSELINGQTYTHSYTYNMYDQIKDHVYPSAYGTTTNYNADGYFVNICKLGSTDPLYIANAVNGQGQVTQYTMANGAQSSINYLHGLPITFNTPNIQDYNLTYNLQTGNIESRSEAHVSYIEENFNYDNKDRLTSAQVFNTGNGLPTVNYEYDNNAVNTSPGNLTLKSDVGKYNYGALPRGAVTTIQDPAANFLMPGSSPLLISHGTQDIAYNAYDLVQNISEYDYNNTAIQNIQTFKYNQGSRVMSTLTTAGINPRTRIYNGDYETQLEAGVLQQLHYISTPTGLSLIVLIENGVETNNYIYTDHLGSIVTVTDEAANIIAEQSFDAWGMPRDPYTWDASVSITNTNPTWLYRGFTGHEMMPEFALINMNARLYDYQNGRMLQPDAFTSVGSQGLNKYSYARNNPMVYVDPDGNHPLLIAAGIGAGISVVTNGINNAINGRPFFEGAGQAALVGAIGGLVSSGIGDVAMGMSGISKIAYQTLAHGNLGGMMSEWSGGSYGRGFLAGASGSLIGGASSSLLNGTSKAAQAIGTVVTGGVAGGLGSVISGGSFWDGARNGLISAGLNHGAHLALDENGEKIYDDDGDYVGKIYVEKFHKTKTWNEESRNWVFGLRIELGFKAVSNKYSDYNWLQTVTTNVSSTGSIGTFYFNDPGGHDNYPFYYNKAATWMIKGFNGFTTYFGDNPGRYLSKVSTNWSAELSLMGKLGGFYQPITTFSYGFNTNTYGGQYNYPLHIISPNRKFGYNNFLINN